jgi:hypothetical protein
MHANDRVGSWHAWYAELAAIPFLLIFISVALVVA